MFYDSCEEESGYTCSEDSEDLSTCVTVCGDSLVLGDEECDDGNSISTDSCINCQLAKVGDGYIEEGKETCDDGNTSDLSLNSMSKTSLITPSPPDFFVTNFESFSSSYFLKKLSYSKELSI